MDSLAWNEVKKYICMFFRFYHDLILHQKISSVARNMILVRVFNSHSEITAGKDHNKN